MQNKLANHATFCELCCRRLHEVFWALLSTGPQEPSLTLGRVQAARPGCPAHLPCCCLVPPAGKVISCPEPQLWQPWGWGIRVTIKVTESFIGDDMGERVRVNGDEQSPG